MKTSNPFQQLTTLPPEISRQEIDSFLEHLPALATVSTPSWWRKVTRWQTGFLIVAMIGGIILIATRLDKPGQIQPLTELSANMGPEMRANSTLKQAQILTDTSTLTPSKSIALVDTFSQTVIEPVSEEETRLKFNTSETKHTLLPIMEELAQIDEQLELPGDIQDTGQSWPLQSYSFSDNDEPNEDRFDQLNLIKLRRVLRRQLLRDGLIQSKRDTIDLWLQEDVIYLNKEELMPDLQLTYRRLAEDFKLGHGSERHIKINTQGIAVGDFNAQGFRGTAQGTFRLNFLDASPPDSSHLLHE